MYCGDAYVPGAFSIFHMWIMIDGKILDLKAKMWFGPDAKEGLFNEDESIVNYSEYGHPMKDVCTSEFLFEILNT